MIEAGAAAAGCTGTEGIRREKSGRAGCVLMMEVRRVTNRLEGANFASNGSRKFDVFMTFSSLRQIN
jgi:hypothetical protein